MMKYIDINLYASIMRSFFEKKSLVFSASDTPCRNIILSLHFFIFNFFWKCDGLRLAVSLQKNNAVKTLKKYFLRMERLWFLSAI